MRRFAHTSTLSLVLGLVAGPSFADWAPTSGPDGVRIVGMSVEETSGRIYIAEAQRLHRSEDDGITWETIGGVAGISNINDVHAAPGGVVLVGVSLRGVFWSTDGGESWDSDQITHAPHTGFGATISAVALSPNGTWLASGFRSANGGASWLQMSIHGRAFVNVGTTTLAGTSTGVHASTTNGASWAPSDDGIEGQFVQTFTIDAAGRVYAGTQAAGVFRSDDGGATWSPTSSGLGSLDVRALAADGAGRLYAATHGGGIHVSTDAAMTWAPAPGAAPDPVATGVAVDGDGNVFAGSLSGIAFSPDLGATWEVRNEGLTTPSITSLAFTTSGIGVVGSFGGGTYRSTDGGGSWTPALPGLANRLVGSVFETPGADVLVGTWNGVFRSTDGGSTWSASGLSNERVADLAAAPDGTIYAVVEVLGGTAIAFRSTDDGLTWTMVLETADVSVPGSFSRVVVDEAGNVLVAGDSFVGAGLVMVSEDGGETWTERSAGAVGNRTADAATDGTAVYLLTENPDGLFVSDDIGATWTPIAVPWTTGALAITIAPGGELWTATLVEGVFRSADGGASWSTFNDGFGATLPSVMAIAHHDGFVYAGTAADGLFRSPADPTVAVPDVPTAGDRLAVRPNPFTARAGIAYELGAAGTTRIDVFGVDGRHVRRLFDGVRPAGRGHVVWDGRDARGRGVSPGTYIVRIVPAHGESTSRRVTLLR